MTGKVDVTVWADSSEGQPSAWKLEFTTNPSAGQPIAVLTARDDLIITEASDSGFIYKKINLTSSDVALLQLFLEKVKFS